MFIYLFFFEIGALSAIEEGQLRCWIGSTNPGRVTLTFPFTWIHSTSFHWHSNHDHSATGTTHGQRHLVFELSKDAKALTNSIAKLRPSSKRPYEGRHSLDVSIEHAPDNITIKMWSLFTEVLRH